MYSRVRNEGSFVYPYELFCKDKHLSQKTAITEMTDAVEFLLGVYQIQQVPITTQQSVPLPGALCSP